MSGSNDLRTIIDVALRAEKTLVGYGMWSPDHRNQCHRWVRAIEIGGEIHGIRLEIKHYLASITPKFRILLTVEKCVWRIDFGEGEEHQNPLDAPAHRGQMIVGSHYHPWADNRHYAKANSLPTRLRAARILPGEIKTFVEAFRWFCEQTNIRIKDTEIPVLPAKELLL